MNLLILGSTGRTGRELTNQALEAGHFVTAIVRDSAKITLTNTNLKVITGDIFKLEDLTSALVNQDAVLVTLGPKKISDSIIEKSLKTLIPAMEASKGKRIIILSSQFASEDYPISLIQKPFFLIMHKLFKDKVNAERMLKASNLDWTIVYATALTNGEHDKNYKVEYSLPKGLSFLGSISRSNVADLMLKCLADSSTIKKSPVISST